MASEHRYKKSATPCKHPLLSAIYPLVTRHLGFPFHMTLPWPADSTFHLPAFSGPCTPLQWTQNTNTIESTETTLPPNSVARFYNYKVYFLLTYILSKHVRLGENFL